MWQYGCNITNNIKSAFNQTLKSINKAKQVRFRPKHTVGLIKDTSVVMITYNSGADGHYISEKDRKAAGLPILRPSTKQDKNCAYVYFFQCNTSRPLAIVPSVIVLVIVLIIVIFIIIVWLVVV